MQSLMRHNTTARFVGSAARQRGSGFTLIEILVVLGVIGLLLALLLPVLGGVQNRGRKTQEMNSLRQYGIGWQAYANQNNDSILPGFLPEEVQDLWKVTYRYNPNDEIENQLFAEPYTWRLMPFLSYNAEIVASYREPEWGPREIVNNAQDVSVHPPFGYNGYLLGGYYEVVQVSGQSIARPQYSSSDENIIARRMANLRRTSDQIVFGAAVLRTTGVHPVEISPFEEGTHLLTPPYLHDEDGSNLQQRWWVAMSGAIADGGGSAASQTELEVFVDDTGVPAGRHAQTTAISFADGHVDSIIAGSQSMLDRRAWVYSANERQWVEP